jgi:hypothetical protein
MQSGYSVVDSAVGRAQINRRMTVSASQRAIVAGALASIFRDVWLVMGV